MPDINAAIPNIMSSLSPRDMLVIIRAKKVLISVHTSKNLDLKFSYCSSLSLSILANCSCLCPSFAEGLLPQLMSWIFAIAYVVIILT